MPGMETRQQGIGGVPKLLAAGAFQPLQGFQDLFLDFLGELLAFLVVEGAYLGGDGETGGNGNVQASHLGKVAALAPEKVAHRGIALVAITAKRVDMFGHRVPRVNLQNNEVR